MPYNIKIQNFDGVPLAGTLYLFDSAGNEIGSAGISAGGSTLDDSEITGATHFRVTAPGYSWYGTSQLYDTNTFTLSKEVKTYTVAYIIGGLVAGYLLSKMINFK
jgi:hypothetical protein